MKIKESHLRNFIRQQIKEMAYAGRFETGYDKNVTWGDDHHKNKIKKYVTSKTFDRLAKLNFEKIPWNVWIAPLIGFYKGVSEQGDETRAIIEPLETKGINILREYGYEIPENFGKDDVVILFATYMMEKGDIATPWMIIHSMFDNDNTEVFSETYANVVQGALDLTYKGIIPPENIAILGGDSFYENWRHALTMRSARMDKISVASDAFAEIMCQELLTKSGFTINDSGAEQEYIDALYALKPVIKQCANEFNSNIRGKLIITAVN